MTRCYITLHYIVHTLRTYITYITLHMYVHYITLHYITLHIRTYVVHTSQRACHGQTTLKQRCINVCNVYTTLFERRLAMMCPLGYIHTNEYTLSISTIQKISICCISKTAYTDIIDLSS